MNRYDHSFRTLPAFIRANASQKIGAARGALIQHRSNGFGPEDDELIVRQFDLSGMAEFWEIELSEPMECETFAHNLAIHFLVITDRSGAGDEERKQFGPAAIRVVDGMKAGIRKALRDARSYGEPWFMEILSPPPSSKIEEKSSFGFVPPGVVVVPPEPPSDGIYLERVRVRPREAGEWMMASPKRRHLVPPSLATVLRPVDTSPAKQPLATSAVASSGGPGRPTSMHLVEAEMARRVKDGEVERTMRAEAKALAEWLKSTHPTVPKLTAKTIENKQSAKFRSSQK